MKPWHRDHDHRSMPFAEWPRPDRELWQAALADDDPLEERGIRAQYRPVSNRSVAGAYGRWLTWLSRRVALEESQPADRLTPEHVSAYASYLSQMVAPGTALMYLHALYQMAVVMDPGRDWKWMRELVSHFRVRSEPVRRRRDKVVGSHELLLLGQKLMSGGAAHPSGHLRAGTYRNGLIISLLAARPLRMRKLAGLEIDRTLVRRGSVWWIDIPAEETKAHEPIEAPWPEESTPALGVYLNKHRPVLSNRVGRCTRPVANALWVSSDGSPMRPRALYDIIVARTAEAYGTPIDPHVFRDCAATSIAIEDPEHVRIALQILGHRSTATTERYYNQAQAIDAARRYQDFVVDLRNGRMNADPDFKES